jgi:Ca-activated chloride channel family protein
MGITVDTPLVLLLLPVSIAVVVGLHIAGRHRVGLGRRRLALAVRAALLTCLVLALAGFQLTLPVDRLATVFVVDLSDSVATAGREAAIAFIRESLKTMPAGDEAGIVAFGSDAFVERLPSDLRELSTLASTPARQATDIGGALRLASALFPDDAQKRIVLLTDGNDTTGRGQTEAALAAARGVRVETHTIGIGAADEVLVERVTTPATSRVGEELEVVAQIRSTVAQPATLRLFVDRALAATDRVSLDAGTNRSTFRFTPQEAGFHTFQVVVEAARDTFDANDRGDSDTVVKGEPRILVAAGDQAAAAQIVGALRTQQRTVDVVVPELIPEDLTALAAYDSVVLVDVPRLRLSDRQLATLQVFVRDLGRGLMAVGGPQSYGAGGYTGTPLEETLPVDMGVRDREKQPDVALVVVIDKSGSMDACHCNSFDRGSATMTGVRKVDIGKEAILRAAAALTSRDQIGVVAFDQAAHWVVKTEPLGSVGDLAGAIGGIQPDGQTNIFAGLDAAVSSLETSAATRRHIILLTDGWSSSGAYQAILARMKAAGITLSTVGAGGGAAPVLQDLAKQGGGRFYDAVNPASIPDIFLKETQQVSGQQIVEERFYPIQTGASPILRGLEDGLPALLGYDGTTAKPAANTVLVSDRDDPVLAQWQYGLGRTVAWTSDATGRWARSWVDWAGFTRFFDQAVAWTFPGEESAGIEASFEPHGSETTLRVESVSEDGSPRDFYDTRATVVGPDLLSEDVDLTQIGPGVYEAPLGELDPGAYAIRVTQTRPGSSALGRTLGLVAPTAAEYRDLGTNEALLAALRAATGGSAIDDPDAVWVHDLSTTTSSTELWPLLLVLALLLWPLDIALRRVSIGRRDLAAARVWFRAIPARRRRTAARTATATTLLAARERAAGSGARLAILRGDAPARSEAVPRATEGVSGLTGKAPLGTGDATADAGAAPAPSGPGGAWDRERPMTSTSADAGSEAASASQGTPETSDGMPDDTFARLRDAKRRAGR